MFFSFVCVLLLVDLIRFHLGGPSDNLGDAWGVLQTSLEVLGGCVHEIRGSKEGSWTPYLAIQRGVFDAKVAILLRFFDDFQKRCFFQRRAPEVVKMR